jgi:hypothetical protein
MSTLSIRLPESIHANAKRLAKRDSCSLNQLIASAVGEKLAAMEAETYLAERAARGQSVDIAAILAKVPAVAPAAEDQLK